jgi:CRP/FNR family transcriptional regulator
LSVFLTRKELANFVGTATETIIRLLSDFKKDDLVDLAGRKILIKDIPGLVRMSRL